MCIILEKKIVSFREAGQVFILKVKNIHRIIMAIPGIFVVIVLFLSRQIELAMLLLVFDVIGTFGGIWWLSASKKVAERMQNALSKAHGHILTPSRILRIFAVCIVVVFVMWGMVSLVKIAVGNVVNLRCVMDIPQQAWVQFGNCLKDAGNCTNPLLACKG